MNNIITLQQIARETLPCLIDNLVFPRLIYRDTGDATAARKGDTVLIRRSAQFDAKSFVQDAETETQTITEDVVEVHLDNIATVDAVIGAWDAYDDETIRRAFIEPAAAALAEKINSDGLALYRYVPNITRIPGDGSGVDLLADAAYEMDIRKTPVNGRCGVFNPDHAKKIRSIGNLTGIPDDPWALGKCCGINTYMSQAVAHHTPGTLYDYMAGGKTVTVKNVDSTTNKVMLTAVDAIGSMTVLAGDILTIGGKQYTALADSQTVGSNMLVMVSPVFTGAVGDVVTMAGAHDANLVFHPHAFAFVTRPLSSPAGVESYVTTYNGISLRVVRGYDMKTKQEMLSMDVLYGFKAVCPELSARVSYDAETL